MKNRFQALTFQRALDRFSRHLLPPGTRLQITHYEILIVNAGELKVQLSSAYRRFPHQTGVTERSIGSNDRSTSDNVLNKMVVSHESHRISRSFAIDLNCQNNILRCHKCGLIYFCISGISEGIEHPFEMILAREPGCCEQRENHFEWMFNPLANATYAKVNE